MAARRTPRSRREVAAHGPRRDRPRHLDGLARVSKSRSRDERAGLGEADVASAQGGAIQDAVREARRSAGTRVNPRSDRRCWWATRPGHGVHRVGVSGVEPDAATVTSADPGPHASKGAPVGGPRRLACRELVSACTLDGLVSIRARPPLTSGERGVETLLGARAEGLSGRGRGSRPRARPRRPRPGSGIGRRSPGPIRGCGSCRARRSSRSRRRMRWRRRSPRRPATST